jgi:hypothetical protein
MNSNALPSPFFTGFYAYVLKIQFSGFTLVMHMAITGNERVVRVLMEARANLEARDRFL